MVLGEIDENGPNFLRVAYFPAEDVSFPAPLRQSKRAI
jgi:hypothetical protein